MIERALNAKKVRVYLGGVAAQLIVLGVVPDALLPWVAGFVAILTGLGIYQAENEPLPAE
jgi:hypothetical protein